MPSIIPGYLYSLFAALIIGSILVCTVSVQTVAIKSKADQQQLQNIEHYVAAQALTLLTQTAIDHQQTIQYLDIPHAIGNQRFTIRLSNDTESAWVESGFGINATAQSVMELPAKVAASGSYISGSGRPLLTCHIENQAATLTLTYE